MKIKNYTPHPVTLIGDDLSEHTIPSLGVTRVEEEKESFGCVPFIINGKDVCVNKVKKDFKKDLINLPSPEKDTVFIVSAPVFAMTDRKDVVGLDDFKRDENGRIIGAASLRFK
jgi:hypothetical protein